MNYTIRTMQETDWNRVQEIYLQGIASKKSTFETSAPEYAVWDKNHLKENRFVAVNDHDQVIGWIALTPTSSRYAYRGVMDISVYVAEEAKRCGIGYALIMKTIEETEKMGIWTLCSGIFATNEASLSLHKKCGFRVIGRRERIAQDADGIWQDTILMERRSNL